MNNEPKLILDEIKERKKIIRSPELWGMVFLMILLFISIIIILIIAFI